MNKIFNIFKEKTLESQQNYIKNLDNFFGQSPSMKLIDIDFQKPWWWILTQLKAKLSFLWVIGSVNGVFWVVFPILVVKCLESGNFTNFIYLIIFRIGILILSLFPYGFEPEVFMQLYWSVFNSTTKFFLSVDPVSHSIRSTGTIISKVQRGRDSYFDLLAIITWEILPLFISFITVVLIFLSVDFWLAFASLISLVGCILLTIFCQWFNASFTHKVWIDLEDKTKAFGIENLQQMQFIRSTFATIPQLKIQTKMTKKLMRYGRAIWLAYIWFYHVPLIAYFASLIWIGYIIFNQISLNNISLAVGTGLMGTYFLGSNNISEFGEKAKRMTEKITDIKDLYSFIGDFGKQSFPVLENDELRTSSK